MADRFAHSNQVMWPRDMSDRKVKLQDPHPVHQKPLPRVETRVKQLTHLVSIAGINTRTVLINRKIALWLDTRLSVGGFACLNR